MRDEGIRALLSAERNGVLATLSARHGGWPFASVAPYALSGQGEPVLLLSDLAEHTRNILADSRASLFVQDQASLADPQAGARVTLLGTVERVSADEEESARMRYLARYAESREYLWLGDFKFYVLRLVAARFVGGFGDMGWIDGASLGADFRTRLEEH
jgi:putative heme iron utilization protein